MKFGSEGISEQSEAVYHLFVFHYRGADKSLARPGRKQATANKI